MLFFSARKFDAFYVAGYLVVTNRGIEGLANEEKHVQWDKTTLSYPPSYWEAGGFLTIEVDCRFRSLESKLLC